MSAQVQAKFVTGSVMKHITVMSVSSAVGLMALFFVDLLDMFFISMLGDLDLTAAIGFAGIVVFFATSISVGTSIAMGAIVSRAIGAGKRDVARNMASSVLLVSLAVSLTVVSCLLFSLDSLLALLGASGNVAEKAKDYLTIMLPSAPLVAMGMAGAAALRAVGDAKRSMSATLAGGAANAVLDPIFIFTLSMGIEGAAIASVISRVVLFAVSMRGVIKIHDLLALPTVKNFLHALNPIAKIAIPAVLTNLATPISNAIVTSQVAKFGEEFVAGFAVIGRLMPVSFALVFSLSGAVGPIIGQNVGAGVISRVRLTVYEALKFMIAYCVLAAGVLFIARNALVDAFSLHGDAADMVLLFCTYLAITFIFNGMLFVSNAAFNNLGKPTWSTMLNMGKATLGTIPFVYIGGGIGGAQGVLIGNAVGSLVFGILAYTIVLRFISGIEQKQ
ncbi:MATE family efflux transporter [Veronia pacifica]|uniref:Multidrug resistance protein NorM n=1 Tax=Veronia pacifica TaxID=1080227 RepID=A0A1C3EPM9_9GAMM|nr:MATE family efflux transporter [Veronia pacifica]ODA35200.1 MATE family efflux transporter [Veronia pacifica]